MKTHLKALVQLQRMKRQAQIDANSIPLISASALEYDMRAINVAIDNLVHSRDKLINILKEEKTKIADLVPTAVPVPTAVMQQSSVMPQPVPLPTYQDRQRQPYSFQFPSNQQDAKSPMSGGTWAIPQQFSNSPQPRAQTGPPNRPPPPIPTRPPPPLPTQTPSILTRTTSGRSTVKRSKSFGI
jgi:hypothetical protein